MAPLRPRTHTRTPQNRRSFRPSRGNLTGREERIFDTNRALLAKSQLLSSLRLRLQGLFNSDRTAKHIVSAVAAALLAVEPAAWSMEQFGKGELMLDDMRRIAIVKGETLTRLHKMDALPSPLVSGSHSIKSASTTVRHREGDMIGELSWLTDGPAAGLVEAKPGFGSRTSDALTAKSSFGEIQKWILGAGATKFLTNLEKYLQEQGVLEHMTAHGLKPMDLAKMSLDEMALAAAGSGDYLNQSTLKGKNKPQETPILGATHIPLDLQARLESRLTVNERLGSPHVPEGHVQWKDGLIQPGQVVEVKRGTAQLRVNGKVVARLGRRAFAGYQAAMGNQGLSNRVSIGFERGTSVAVHDLSRVMSPDSIEAARLSVAIQQTANTASRSGQSKRHTVHVKDLELATGWMAA